MNVWSQWHEDTDKDLEEMLVLEASSEFFEPELLIKDKE